MVQTFIFENFILFVHFITFLHILSIGQNFKCVIGVCVSLLALCCIFLLQQLTLLARPQVHVRGAEPHGDPVAGHELAIHQSIVSRTTPGLQLAVANGTDEAALVH